MQIYRSVVKPILFLFDPETAHRMTFSLLRIACAIPGVKKALRSIFMSYRPEEEVLVAGIRFPNRVGLAAGLDKDARMVEQMACLGFGFIEIGTVTPLAQPGNEKPRLFRLVSDEAIVNRMGFNNEGAAAAARRLKSRKSPVVIGGNIGKNKLTPNENAAQDYLTCFRELFDVVDYFVVNVSSPNTPGLRALQEKEPLTKLLLELQSLNESMSSVHGSGRRRPIFLKIAPDLENSQLDDIADIVYATGIDGIVATNTTVSRKNLRDPAKEIERIGPGGVSGIPLRRRSTEVIRYLHARSGGKIPVIGVGGIHAPEDALEKIQAGASLVQVYTGFIYEGPSLVRRIRRALMRK